jgi:hypothetical protein
MVGFNTFKPKKAEDFGALETAKLLNCPLKTPRCSLRGSL